MVKSSVDDSGLALSGITPYQFTQYCPNKCISVVTYIMYESTIDFDGETFSDTKLWVLTYPQPHLLLKKLAGLKDRYPNACYEEVRAHFEGGR